LRYRRQGYELNLAFDAQKPEGAIEAFHELHRRRYGFADASQPVEIVNLRLRMVAASESYEPERQELVAGDGSAAVYAEREVYFDRRWRATQFYQREKLTPGNAIAGPAMVTEYTAATLVLPGCTLQVDGQGNLLVDVGEEERR
jgi:N-methylhydantoinase A